MQGSHEHTPPGMLRNRRVGILMESDFVEDEIAFYRMRFAEEGARVDLLTRLWGNESMAFTGHEYRATVTVDGDIESVGYNALSRYSALIVPSGMVSDRLRYSENPNLPSPAVEVIRRAFRLPHLLKAFSCHALWLLAGVPELVRDRPVACHNNLVGDVRNMGAQYLDQDVVVDRDLVTSRTVAQAPLLARTVIHLLSNRSQGT